MRPSILQSHCFRSCFFFTSAVINTAVVQIDDGRKRLSWFTTCRLL